MIKPSVNFWLEGGIQKSLGENGEEEFYFQGMASDNTEDRQGQTLEPSGFRITNFLEKGFVNWHHKATDSPDNIIGEPVSAEVIDDKFFVKVKLYPEMEKAKGLIELADALKKSNSKRKLGFSIEGNPIGQDKKDKRIKNLEITGLAITHKPVNRNTYAQIVKGETENLYIPIEEDEVLAEVEKSMNTDSTRPLIRESLEGDGKNREKIEENEEYNEEVEKMLKKSDVYDLIIKSFPDCENKTYRDIFQFVNKYTNNMAVEGNVKKALEVLVQKSDEISIGAEKTEEIVKSEVETAAAPEEQVQTEQPSETELMKSTAEGIYSSGMSEDELAKGMMDKGIQYSKIRDFITGFIVEKTTPEMTEIEKSMKGIEDGIVNRLTTVFDRKFKASAELHKSQNDQIDGLLKKVEELEKRPVYATGVRKSVGMIPSPMEIQKGENDEIQKGENHFDLNNRIDKERLANRMMIEADVLRRSGKPDNELEKAVSYVELGSPFVDLPPTVQQRLKLAGCTFS